MTRDRCGPSQCLRERGQSDRRAHPSSFYGQLRCGSGHCGCGHRDDCGGHGRVASRQGHVRFRHHQVSRRHHHGPVSTVMRAANTVMTVCIAVVSAAGAVGNPAVRACPLTRHAWVVRLPLAMHSHGHCYSKDSRDFSRHSRDFAQDAHGLARHVCRIAIARWVRCVRRQVTRRRRSPSKHPGWVDQLHC
jgi:hypothetical protein